MKDTIKGFETLAQSLAQFFKPQLQVSLVHQTQGEVATFNRLDQSVIGEIDNIEVQRLDNPNQMLKTVKIPLDKDYALELVHDVTMLANLQAMLNTQLAVASPEKPPTALGFEHMDAVMEDYLECHELTLAALKAQDKRALVFHLQEQGALKYQDASKYLAKKLNVSRATIYNYLKTANQLKGISVHQVDAFTNEPFSGNPAGVVLDADTLDVPTMKKIAREMNLSETAFVFEGDKTDIKIRYFTPTGDEVRFCGHSTVGALYMLAHEKRFGIEGPGRYRLSIDTLINPLEATISIDKQDSVTIAFEAPKEQLVDLNITIDDLAKALDLDPDLLDERFDLAYEPANQDLFIPVRTLQALEQLHIPQKLAKQFSDAHDIVALCFLCVETFSKDSDIHARCFAPAVGIPEDPFTGSVLGGLAQYVVINGLIPKNKQSFRVEQGHFMDRPGFVDLTLSGNGDDMVVTVEAKARHFFSTVVEL